MAIEYHISTLGSDDHSGSSESVIVSGIEAETTAGSDVVTLDEDPTSVTAGDTIRIAGRTDGIHGTDIFEIIDVGSFQVRVSPTPTVSASGLTWTIGGAFATPQKAADCVNPGDTIWIKADGAYLPDGAPIVTLKTKGTLAEPIVIEGYRDTKGDATAFFQANAQAWPSDARFDVYRACLDCNGLSLAAISKGSLSWGLSYVIKNIQTQNRIEGPALEVARDVLFVNCAGQNNFIDLYASDRCIAINCLFDGFTLYGIYGPVNVLASDFVNGAGTPYAGLGSLQFCRLLNNDGNGVDTTFTYNPPVIHCTIVGSDAAKANGKAGLHFSAYSALAANNIIHNYAVGVKASESAGPTIALRNNLITNCTANYENVPPGEGDVIAGDPKFVDPANGDYRLRSISPAIDRALRSGDIGAEQRPGNHHGLLRMGAG